MDDKRWWYQLTKKEIEDANKAFFDGFKSVWVFAVIVFAAIYYLLW